MNGNCRTAVLSIASYLLFVCVPVFHTLILSGLLRLLVFLVLTYLLMFVTEHSTRICIEMWACLQLIPAHLFALSPRFHRIDGLLGRKLLRDEPFLPALFQRPPPPIVSL
jgi:hypothetical protein